jgi:hypothetical protein
VRDVNEPRYDQRGERERGHRHPERPADVEDSDEQPGDRSSEQVSDVLRRGEQGVRALARVPAGIRRHRHQALPRGRPSRVSERADDGQQHDVPDLQRVQREENRQRRDRESADEIGGCACANRADRVHNPTSQQTTDGGGPGAGKDSNPGEHGAARRGQH